jgi:hypothetical protein
MVSPAIIAVLAIVVHLEIAPWATRLKLMPVLETGRVLVTVGLVTKVITTKESE